MVRDLLIIGRKIGRRSVLIPTTDECAVFVEEHADVLKERFIFPNRSADLVLSLCNKKTMYYLAKKFKLPTPEAAFPKNRDDVVNFLKLASFPIMIKAIQGWGRLKPGRTTSIIAHNKRDLLEKYGAMENAGGLNLILQEYIPGADDKVWMFNGYFNERSDCLLGFTGRKMRQWPIHRGVTSLGVCLRNGTVQKATKEFMKSIGYRGIVDMGYLYDPRDDQYKVFDINPRIGATFRLFVARNGMDVARALYFDMTGQSVIDEAAPDNRKWFVEDLDLQSSLLYFMEGSLTVRQWVASYKGVRETAYLALDDPLPFLQMFALHLRSNFRPHDLRRVTDVGLRCGLRRPPRQSHPSVRYGLSERGDSPPPLPKYDRVREITTKVSPSDMPATKRSLVDNQH